MQQTKSIVNNLINELYKIILTTRKREITAKCIGSFVILLTLRKIFCKLYRKYYSLPPGPDGLPFLGGLFFAINLPVFTTRIRK